MKWGGYLRLTNGIQICWGSIDKGTSNVSFIKPFIDVNWRISFASTYYTTDSVTERFITAWDKKTTGFTTFSASKSSRDYIAIGNWK